MKQKSTFLKVFMTLLLLLGVSSVWAQDYSQVMQLDLTTKTAGCAAYNTSTAYGDWTIVNGANNNKGWEYFKMGGKSATLSSANPCYIYSIAATTDQVDKITVSIASGSLAKTGMSVNSWGVYVYSDKDMKTQIDYVAGGEITKNAAKFDFVPSAGKTWASGYYYKVSWDLSNTTSTNGIVCVDKITLYKKAQAGTTFNVLVDDEIENGTLTVSPNSNVSANSPVTVTPNPEAGYTLDEILAMGETSGDEIKLSENKGVYTFTMPSENVEITATFKSLPTHTVTLVQPEGASLTINGGTEALQLYEGQQVDISVEGVTPGYTWGKWTVEGTGAKVSTLTAKNTKFTMGTSDATLSGETNKLPVYTVTFMDKGAVYASKTVYKTQTYADALDGVSNPSNDDANYSGFSFKGWSKSQDIEDIDFIASGEEVPGSITLYAIYSKGGNISWNQTTSVSIGDEVVLAEIDDSNKEMSAFSTTSTIYGIGSDFEETPEGSLTFKVEAGSSTGTFAFKSTQSGKYLNWPSETEKNSINESETKGATSSWAVSTSNERAKITNAGTDTRVICWNQNNPRFACYDNKQHGEAVTTNGSSYYYYPVFYVKSGTDGEYSLEGPQSQNVTISSVGYSTYSSTSALVVPADETVYGAKIKNENSVELIPVEAGTVIAAGEGFIVKGEANGTVTFTVSSEAGAKISGNELLGTGDETIDLSAGDAYLLAAKDGKAIFGLCGEGTLGANKACLPAPSGANSVLGFDDATGIIAVSNNVINNGAMYNLAGQKVGSDYKGIVIVNGMKFLNK